ncbi:hypothetical protein J25TS5_04570 [Paenibacillus faecis]|uniref:GTPase-activating protein n=1 Tax=Paenibacillus faecis TaxID=862114 RepID=UPI001B090428|nr:GTPase-activating protein [Paenibacillus faecis]GIO83525.1 hypothetical protein J25TS5_04570 [Paenibacillus faecis]
MSHNFSEIAKEITIAAIEKGAIVFPGKGSYDGSKEIEKFNTIRANEIAKLYKIISKAVNEVVQGDFEIKNEQD